MLDVKTFVEEHGWEHKEHGGEVWVAPCPVCQNTDAGDLRAMRGFSINVESGAAHCLKCGWKGNLYTLATEILKESPPGREAQVRPAWRGRPRAEEVKSVAFYREALRQNESARAYLKGRGFKGWGTVNAWGIGYNAGARAIAIPTLLPGQDRPVGWKFRRVEAEDRGSRFFRTPGSPSCLVGLHLLDRPAHGDAVIVTEGELDAAALYEVGYRNVVGVPAGAGTFRPEWADALAGYSPVLVCYDADEHGEAGAEVAAKVLGPYRCKRVRLPHKDAADCLAAGLGKADLDPVFASAEPMHGASALRSPAALFDDLLARVEGKDDRGIATGIADLDHALSGLKPGKVTLLTGKTGNGKSTLALSVAFDLLLRGVPVMASSFEYDDADLLGLFAAMGLGKARTEVTPKDVKRHREGLLALPLCILPAGEPYPLADLLAEIRTAVYGYACRLVLIDPLDWTVPYGPRAETRYADVARYLRGLLAGLREEELPAHVLLVVSPRKTQDGRNVVAEDIAGAQSLGADAWNIVAVRAPEQVEGDEPTTLAFVDVLKARTTGIKGKTLRLRYLRSGGRIVQPDRGGSPA